MRLKTFIVILHLLISYSGNIYSDTISDRFDPTWKLYIEELQYLDSDLDSAYQISSNYLTHSTSNNDTSAQVMCLISMADIKKNRGDYSKSYDHIWEAQLLAESSGDTIHLAQCHYMLGMLYGIFNKDDEAIKHMQEALKLRKLLFNNGKIKNQELISNYFGIAVRYSRSQNYKEANTYLDSCITLTDKFDIEPYYILAERAYIAINENRLTKAEDILTEISPYFIENKIRFEVMVYSFWGRLKVKQAQWDEALNHYKQCLQVMQKTNMHTDIKPEVLDEIAKIYAKLGKQELAYNYLADAKQINDSLFNARNNGDLLEVKNRYREVMQQKNAEIAQQNSLLEDKKIQNLRLKVLLGLVFVLVILAALLVKNWFQRKQLINTEYKAKLKIKLEKEKHEEVVEVKNKEITSYTLQLIDKERAIDELLKELQNHIDDVAFRGIRNRTKDFNKNLWNEFNERFTMVNTSFYEKLQNSYPSLSPTDLKHCALIKLNFNGKEMAQLLNISLSSVHIARHRVRKKFNLSRQDNLAKFISEI